MLLPVTCYATKKDLVVTHKSDIQEALYQHRVWDASSASMGTRFAMSGTHRHLKFLNEHIPYASFEDFEAHNVDFRGANLRAAEFKYCVLENVDFRYTDLTGTSFKCVVFVNAKFDQNFSHTMHVQHCWFETDVLPWFLLSPFSTEYLRMNNIVEKGKIDIELALQQFERFKNYYEVYR